MSWALQLQNASYKGVRFDVFNVTDSGNRVLVEHEYPYVDGGDIEDMGTGIHEVKIQAVFWGDQYEIKLKNLLNTLQNDVGAGLLVHPIFGRMPDMACPSWSFSHEAEMVNYVAIDLSFKKATKGNPIFADVSIFGVIDKIMAKIQSLVDAVSELYERFEGVMIGVAGYKSQAKGMLAVFKTIELDFKSRLNSVNTSFNGSLNTGSAGSNGNNPVHVLQNATDALIDASRVPSSISPMMAFDGVIDTAKSILDMPTNATTNNHKGTMTDIGVPMTPRDALEIRVIVGCIVIGSVTENVIDLVDEYQDALSPAQIEKILNTVREMAQNLIDFIRDSSIQSNNSDNQINQTNKKDQFIQEFAGYDGFYLLIDNIRQIQHALKTFIDRIIAKKPPLIMRLAPFDGTLQQIAHHFYQDLNRFSELLLLNPHLTHPCFIKSGDYINGYAR